MRYLPKSPSDRKEMLATIGAASIDELFSTIPGEYQFKRDLNIPRQHGESEIIERFKAFAANSASGEIGSACLTPAATPAFSAQARTGTIAPSSLIRWCSAASS